MVFGAKVCDLTEDLLWFVCGLYVGILTSPLTYHPPCDLWVVAMLVLWAKPIHSAGGDQHDANYPHTVLTRKLGHTALIN